MFFHDENGQRITVGTSPVKNAYIALCCKACGYVFEPLEPCKEGEEGKSVSCYCKTLEMPQMMQTDDKGKRIDCIACRREKYSKENPDARITMDAHVHTCKHPERRKREDFEVLAKIWDKALRDANREGAWSQEQYDAIFKLVREEKIRFYDQLERCKDIIDE